MSRRAIVARAYLLFYGLIKIMGAPILPYRPVKAPLQS
jgi:hypothetical protein